MDREGFMDTLRTQFAEEIREAYLECEHAGKADFGALNSKLKKIMKMAAAEGFPSREFEELAKSTLPDVAGNIQLGANVSKKAA